MTKYVPISRSGIKVNVRSCARYRLLIGKSIPSRLEMVQDLEGEWTKY